MNKRSSLTINIAVWFGLSLLFTVTIVACIISASLYTHFNTLDKEKLQAIANTAQDLIKEQTLSNSYSTLNTIIKNKQNISLFIYNKKDELLFKDERSHLLLSPTQWKLNIINNWSQNENQYRGIRISGGSNTLSPIFISVVMNKEVHQQFLNKMYTLLFSIFMVTAISLSIGGYYIAWRALKPLRNLGITLTQINASSLSTRLNDQAAHQELAPLVHAFNEMIARIESSFSQLSFFSSHLAHELRTPLSAIILQNQVLLQNERDKKTYQDALRSNLEELEFLSKTVTDILLLTQAQNNQLPFKVEIIELKSLAEKVIEYYQLLAEEKDVRFTVIGDCIVHHDSAHLRRIIGNLLSNATRHADPDSEITIVIIPNEELVTFSVTNQGKSININEQHLIYQHQYRSPASSNINSTEVNIGVGLNICQTIIKAMGGKITLYSKNRETTFTVSLPIEYG